MDDSHDYVLIPNFEPGPLVEQAMSKSQAMYIWLMWSNLSLRTKMHFNGWTENSIKQTKKFISPDGNFKDSPLFKYAEWAFTDLAKDFRVINDEYKKLYLNQEVYK